MDALWIENGQLAQRQLPRPQPAAGEVLLQTRLAGICGTDLALLEGYSGFSGVPGHEFIAEVIEGPAAWLGRRVVAGINLGCGACDFCRQGNPGHCRARQVVGIRDAQGAFAQYLSLPAENLLAVPDELPDELAVFAEPVAAALQILQQINVAVDARVLVIGAGRMAQLITRVMLQAGARVDVLARQAHRWQHFQNLGVNALRHELCQALQQQAEYELVIECSGNPAALATAIAAVRPTGTIVLKSTYAGASSIDASALVVNEITLLGSRCGPMQAALDWLAAGHLRLDELVIQTFDLSAAAPAFAAARAPGISKSLFGF
jgi:threonine dehydrogenase-like Zn-dependent dehydrogenase